MLSVDTVKMLSPVKAKLSILGFLKMMGITQVIFVLPDKKIELCKASVGLSIT